ncbi:MAG: DNA cytosine methyltransferase [Gammaproteobacteria bacterium]|nr:DNA cytosine methyltransferase [Gammaproteobacteria bacterium]
MSRKLSFISLFSGGGGLSEGFIRVGLHPIAHVESDRAACYTLLTRMAYHWMKEHCREKQYSDYLNGRLPRREFYALIPERITNSVINATIAKDTLPQIFKQVDTALDSQKLDLIIGGPPCQAYSLVGRSRDQNRMKGDPRNYLYTYYADFLRKYKPTYFVFENVTGLLSARDTSDKESDRI